MHGCGKRIFPYSAHCTVGNGHWSKNNEPKSILPFATNHALCAPRECRNGSAEDSLLAPQRASIAQTGGFDRSTHNNEPCYGQFLGRPPWTFLVLDQFFVGEKVSGWQARVSIFNASYILRGPKNASHFLPCSRALSYSRMAIPIDEGKAEASVLRLVLCGAFLTSAPPGSEGRSVLLGSCPLAAGEPKQTAFTRNTFEH
mmetsp:Transcript_14118/g.26683  ORF Transcript_14118/g.26683 Transcript_14118/m.26683 type:complete len:200 (-) Transcript_14118:943-1542(-)